MQNILKRVRKNFMQRILLGFMVVTGAKEVDRKSEASGIDQCFRWPSVDYILMERGHKLSGM